MPKENPNIEPFQTLMQLVSDEENRTHQYAVLVKVAPRIAHALVGMDEEDWHAAGRGFFDMSTCNKIAGCFRNERENALKGMSFASVGPKFDVSESNEDPDVVIMKGRPHPGHEPEADL